MSSPSKSKLGFFTDPQHPPLLQWGNRPLGRASIVSLIVDPLAVWMVLPWVTLWMVLPLPGAGRALLPNVDHTTALGVLVMGPVGLRAE